MSPQVAGVLKERLALSVDLSLAPHTPQVSQTRSITSRLVTNATKTLEGQVADQPLVLRGGLRLVLRLLKTFGTRHGLARRLPVNRPDALDARTGGGATHRATLPGRREEERLAGVAVQREVDQLSGSVEVVIVKSAKLDRPTCQCRASGARSCCP